MERLRRGVARTSVYVYYGLEEWGTKKVNSHKSQQAVN